MVKVTYLYHSGFVVELNKYVLIFDYSTPEGIAGNEKKGYAPSVPAGKQLMMFASHKHQDHFQLKALKWAEKVSENTQYFFGNDIKLNENYLERKGMNPALLKRVERMRGGAVYERAKEGFKVETLRSTDQGVAFMVQVENVSIYHAGDLNHWYWEEESTYWNDRMEKDYHKEIDQIAGRYFDIAFVPLDPRLKEGYRYGMDYFLQKVAAENIFPMHMWEEYGVIRQYKQTEIGRQFLAKIKDVSEKNREFLLQA